MKKAPPLVVYLIAILGIVIWGGSPAATKIAVTGIDATTVAVLRTFLAALLVLPIVLAFKLPLPTGKAQCAPLLVSAIIGFVLYATLYSLGLEKTSTLHAALIVAAAPIFTGLIGFSLDKNWPRPIWWIGALIAFGGEIYLIWPNNGDSQGASLEGDLLVICSIICVSAGYVAGGRLSNAVGTWAATSWSLIIAGAIFLPVFLFLAPSLNLSNIPQSSLWAMGYLVIFISIIGYACWYWAIGELGVAAIAPIQFTLPLVSMVLGVILLDETITTDIIGATLAILSGIALTRKA